jgi:branched-chain amino acid aminotransferase
MFENTHFPKAKKFWQSGKFYDWSQPNIHAMTHALHYGTSVFEGIRAYNTDRGPAIFRLPEHIDRLFLSASVQQMNVPYSKEEIIDIIKKVIKENQLQTAYIRPLLFYSYGNLGLVPRVCPVELNVAAWEWGAYLGEKAETGVHVFILPQRRFHHSQLDMRAKLGGMYVQSAIAGMEARARGYDEGVFLNLEGRVAEGPGENIFIVKNGVLKTNDNSESILEGITRSSLLEIAAYLGFPTEIGPITKEEFFTADEAFFCGTAVEVTPIVKISDGSESDSASREYTLGAGSPGEITLKMRQTYKDVVSGKIPEFIKWLTFVNE